MIEIGVPFSDPIADGAVNQAAANRALASGTNLPSVLRLIAEERTNLDVPVVLFTYFNPVLHYGIERFAEHAAASGVDGVLCVDLPPEEAEAEWVPTLRRAGVDTIFLVAPTSPAGRVARACSVSTGFVYFVSRTGVTGERESLADDLARDLKRVRKRCPLPVAVGFGIATSEQAADVGSLADGVVVGSALVRIVEEGGDVEAIAAQLQNRTAEFVSSLKQDRRSWARRVFGR